MFTKLVVGIDERDGGTAALTLAEALAEHDAELVLVHAYPFSYPLGWPEDPPDLSVPARARSEELLQRAAGEDARAQIVAVDDPSPGHALHRIAEERNADVIVVGSSHRGAVGGILVGDVSRAALHGAPCPVAVAPRGYRLPKRWPQVIGVGYDATAAAAEALRVAAALAAERSARLRVLSAAPTPPPLIPGYAANFDLADVGEQRRVLAEQAVQRAVAELQVPAEAEVVAASSGAALEKLSESVDLIVSGSRGWGAARRVVLGSTSDHLARTASCPLLVVTGVADSGTGELARSGSAETIAADQAGDGSAAVAPSPS